ncbi:MAG: Calx-beta domain-containing protein [Steroidobacteraceae bacterium]
MPAATGDTATADPLGFTADNVSVSQSAGSVSITVTRSGTALGAVSVDFDTEDGTAVAGTDYESATGTLQWAEADTSAKTITIPVSNATPFSGVRAFQVVLTNPNGIGAKIGSPGSTTVSISGDATAEVGSIELSGNTYTAPQTAGMATITVNRTGGSAGAVSVAYSTANGTAVSGTDYSAVNGVLEWADGDASSKTVDVPISTAKALAGNKTFSVALSDPRSGVALGSPSSAVVTITGSGSAAAGTLQLSASSYSIAQSSGTLKVSVSRVSGSSGAISVAYATANGTALAGTDYTTAKGTLSWAAGDAAAKTFNVTISNAAPFSGSRNFKVALSNPSSTATIGSPGTATITVNGDAAPAAGALELAKSTYSVAQSAGSVTLTVNRTGGAAGAATVAYSTRSGTAVAGTDFTTSSGTLKWSDTDAASKTFSIPISGSSPFSGTRSFSVALSNLTGSTLGSPGSASVAINGTAAAAVGSLQLSSSGYTVAQSAGTLTVTVNRTGGSSGSISVKYATANGTAAAGTDYTAASGTLQWADGDAASKTFPVAISNATGFTGSKTFTVALSSPTAGATLSSPSSATTTINGSGSSSGSGSSVFQIFHNGVFSWGGDYSWGVTIDYKDTAGIPLQGPYDIAVTGIGGFQPFATNYDFDPSPYKYLVFSLKPTLPNQQFQSGFYKVGDIATGVILNVLNYGPAPVIGQWTTYKIPLGAGGYQLTSGTHIYKFMIQDQTADMQSSGYTTNHWYVDGIYFTTQ